jgi:GntR family transcriptional regulator
MAKLRPTEWSVATMDRQRQLKSVLSQAAPPLEGDKNLPIYRRLCQTLKSQIAAGTLKPGTALPAESEITRTYQIALGTVRRAFEELADEGLIERRQGHGTFVRRPKFDHAMMRFFLFRDASGSMVEPESKIISRTIIKSPPALSMKLALPANTDVIHLVRHRHWENARRLLEDIYVPTTLFSNLMNHTPEEIGPLLYPAYEQLCGQLIFSIEEELAIIDADANDAALLNLEKRDPIISIERTARNAAGLPIEWRISRAEARRFRYRLTVNTAKD